MTKRAKDAGDVAVVVAGDFNMDPWQRQFDGERTLKLFEEAGFTSALASLPAADRVTWPAAQGFPDATLDYVLVKGVQIKSVLVPRAFGGV